MTKPFSIPEAPTDEIDKDFFLKIISNWKYDWMDVTGTDERDRSNYYSRAFGVDANMKYSLARRLVESLTNKLTRASQDQLAAKRMYTDIQFNVGHLKSELFQQNHEFASDKDNLDMALKVIDNVRIRLEKTLADVEKIYGEKK